MEQINRATKNRVAYLDTLRVIACFMVVLVHSPVPHPELSEAPIYGAISYLCSPCIGLFLMVSGALLLPQKLAVRQFVFRRFTRILFPLVVWSIIYILIDAIDNNKTIDDIITNISHIIFGPTAKFVQSWYLYVLLGIYLFIPIFNAWIKENDRRHSLYFILLWCISLCVPYLKALFAGNSITPPYMFAGYFGYIVLGYYLHKYPIKMTSLKTYIIMSSLVVILSGIIPVVIYLANIPGYDYSNIVYNYLSLSTVMMCVCIYTFIQNFNPKNCIFQNVMAHLSPLTFGIFLVNYATIYYIFFPYFSVKPIDNLPVEIAIVFIGSFVISYVITLIINKLPFKKYVIG